MDAPHVPFSFGRYVGLYTLHQVEATGGDVLVMRIRVETLRYSLAPLVACGPLNAAYHADPRAGINQAREIVLPRLEALLDAPEPFEVLNLDAASDDRWQRYAAERGLPAEPVRVPVPGVPVARRVAPPRDRLGRRLAQAQRALELVHTAAETASALAALWQNWRIRQGQRALLADQRALLQDAIRAQLAGQDRALDRAADPVTVRGYLAEHAGDAGYQAVFGPDGGGSAG